MARVIKAGAGGPKPPRPPTRVLVDAGAKKVIEREVYQAKQDAEHILMRAEAERTAILAEGRKQASRAREEAMARGAADAFAAAADEALTAFRKRAERFGEAADDVRVLALEVMKKVLGNDPDLGPSQVERILQKGMAQLRARRRLRLQVSEQRLAELAQERPNLMKALQNEPDLVVEAVDDVGAGFARVVTEVGGALCAEDTALDALSMAVNVRERPRPRPAASVETDVASDPAGLAELRQNLPDVSEGPSDPADLEDDATSFASTPPNRVPTERRPPTRPTDDVEVIEAEEDDDVHATSTRPLARVPDELLARHAGKGPPRVVPIGAEDLVLPRQKTQVKRDEDLDLFTDDAPRRRR